MSLLMLEVAARKKQLGQYFTGRPVGRLLAALADADKARSIIDPMVGSADLLVACLEIGAEPHSLIGIELDPLALEKAREALAGIARAELTLGDAFSTRLPSAQFDLVITNPPYIRYQSKAVVDGIDVPSAESARDGLVRAIQGRAGLSEADRASFVRAARAYPGTADIAVPAWILSAALVTEGGALAVVMPQAWLSRNYAISVRELLDELFDVELIVEDGDASWFDDALVRTQLVVARRRSSASRDRGHSVVIARAVRELKSRDLLIGRLKSEHEVAAQLRKVNSATSVPVTVGLTAYLEHNLLVAASGRADQIPTRIGTAFGGAADNLATRTLESYGWRCGQGLRTGANDFFYLTATDSGMRPAPRWGLEFVTIPEECLEPVVRRQSELGPTPDIIDGALLSSRVLNLRGWATALDQRRMGDAVGVKTLPADAGRWIEAVSKTKLSPESSTRFSELTAVAPNARTDDRGRPTSFWYQMPPLAPRHRPTLFMPRVCGGRPKAYANSIGAVVDANFSTLWPVKHDAIPADAVLAILTSSWASANLEATCTVLGGGALKVEATDLRRLALPDLRPADIARLTTLGYELRTGKIDSVQIEIDSAMNAALTLEVRTSDSGNEMRELAAQLLGQRSRHS